MIKKLSWIYILSVYLTHSIYAEEKEVLVPLLNQNYISTHYLGMSQNSNHRLIEDNIIDKDNNNSNVAIDENSSLETDHSPNPSTEDQSQNFDFDSKELYFQAKKKFQEREYDDTRALLELLINNDNADKKYKPYALFLYSLVFYSDSDLELAEANLNAIMINYPEWENIEEVYYWLAKISFENDQYIKGVKYCDKIQSKGNSQTAYQLKKHYYENAKTPQILQKLLIEFPNDELLIEILSYRIANDPYVERNSSWVSELQKEYNLDIDSHDPISQVQNIKKKSYNIAVLLPFFIDEYEEYKEENKFVYDLYKGLKLARDKLRDEGIEINLFAYDTGRDIDKTREILDKKELKSMDLIIGPLFPETLKLVANFCYLHQINMINPLSINNGISKTNPFVFLYKASIETQARRAAQLITSDEEALDKFSKLNQGSTKLDIKNSSKQKNLISKEEESLMEEDNNDNHSRQMTHKSKSSTLLEEKRIAIIHTNKPEDICRAKEFERYLKNYFDLDIELKLSFSEEEAKSALSLFRRIKGGVKLTNEEIEKRELKKSMLDNITHIFVATNNNLVVSNLFAVLEMRKLSPRVIGHQDWLKNDSIDFKRYERLNVEFIAPLKIDTTKETYSKFKQLYFDKYLEKPQNFSAVGYDLLMFFGHILNEFGIYFQKEWSQSVSKSSYIFQNIKYGRFRDNQMVEIIKFKNGNLVIDYSVPRINPYDTYYSQRSNLSKE